MNEWWGKPMKRKPSPLQAASLERDRALEWLVNSVVFASRYSLEGDRVQLIFAQMELERLVKAATKRP